MNERGTLDPRLEAWTVVEAGISRGLALAGRVYEDGRFAPGRPVVTTRLVDIDLHGGHASTRNTRYRLGQPCPALLAKLAATGQTLDDLVSRMTTGE